MAGTLQERNARYNARRASGTPHPNPFSGLLETITAPAPAGSLPPQLGDGGGLLEGMAANYQQAGGLLSDNPLNVDRTRKQATIDNSPEAMARRTLNPVEVTAQRRESPEGLLGVSPESVPYTPPQPKPVTPQTTVADLQEIQVNAKKREAMERSNKLAVEGRASLQAEGASEQELSVWDKFTSEYDLGAMGAALLASNDGSGNFASNLGKALMVGRAVSERLKDKEIETARYTQEQLDKQIEAQSKRAKREADIRQGDEGLKYESQRAATGDRNADSNAANAWSNRMKANQDSLAASRGPDWESSTGTYDAYAAEGFDRADVNLGEFETSLTPEQIQKMVGSQIRTNFEENPPRSIAEANARVDQVTAEFMQGFENTATFGQDWERK